MSKNVVVVTMESKLQTSNKPGGGDFRKESEWLLTGTNDELRPSSEGVYHSSS